MAQPQKTGLDTVSVSPLLASIAGLMTLATAMGIGRFIYTPILPEMISGDVITRSEAGNLAALNYVGYLLGAYLASFSFWARNLNLWFVAALAVSVVTTMAMGFVHDNLPFGFIRLVSGIASAFAMVFVSSIVLQALRDSGRDALLGLHFSGVGIGILISALLVPQFDNWSEQWVVGGVCALFLTIAAATLMKFAYRNGNKITKPSQSNEAVTGSGRNKPAMRPAQRAIKLLIMSYGLFGFGYIITATFIAELARSVPALNSVQDWIWGIVGIAAVFSTFAINWLGSRIGLLRAYAVACLVEAIGVFLSVVISHPLALIVAAILLGGTFVGATAVGLTAAARMAGKNASINANRDNGTRILALMTTAFGLGQVVGPWLAGYMFEFQGNLVGASMVAVVALLLSGGLGIWADRSAR